MNNLSIKDVNLWYGKFHAIKNVSLPTYKEGDMIGLIGPNAAGKSSLLRALALPGKGSQTILFNGKNHSHLSRKARLKMFGLMTQEPPQPSSLTAYELIWSVSKALNLQFSDDALHIKINQLFQKFGLSDDAFKPLSALSGGKRQLVGIVMLILRAPDIFMLDEPTSALDLHWRLVVLNEIKNHIRKTKKIAFTALHDLNLAARYCDRLVLLNKGQVVASGTPEEVLTESYLKSIYKVESKVSTGSLNRLLIEILGPTEN